VGRSDAVVAFRRDAAVMIHASRSAAFGARIHHHALRAAVASAARREGRACRNREVAMRFAARRFDAASSAVAP